MKLAICGLLVSILLIQGEAYKFDSKKLDKKIAEEGSTVESNKNNDKRGAVEIQASESAYITPAPLLQVSSGPTIVPAVSVTPGIVYAQQKEIIATASPSQIYAKPSPHLAKVAEVIQPAHVTGQIHQQQLYQSLPKVSYNAPAYAITAPIAAHLAYSKHQIYPQQEYHHQPQVHYAAYSQPQSVYVQPQHVNYVQPQVSLVQPHAQQQLIHVQPQVYHSQPQVYHTQPQVYHSQPQVYHSQPQVYHSQPQVYHAQPQVYHHGQAQVVQPQHFSYAQPQVQVYQHQPAAYQQTQAAAYSPVVVAQPITKLAYSQPQVYHNQGLKGDAVSYSSFAQSEFGGVHYPNPLKVIPAPSLVPQAPVIAKQNYQQNYYNSVPYSQGYSTLPQKLAYPQQNNGYSSQYYGKNSQSNQNSFNSYSH